MAGANSYWEADFDKGITAFRLPITGLAAGLYNVVLQSATQTLTQKLVVE